MKIEDIDAFTQHYLIAALWSSTDDDGRPLDDRYDLYNIHPETVAEAYEACQDFQQAQAALLDFAYDFYRHSGMADHPDAGSAEACAGHDFWLTSAGHGVGFQDQGMDAVGRRLADAACIYRAPDLYVADDGKICGM